MQRTTALWAGIVALLAAALMFGGLIAAPPALRAPGAAGFDTRAALVRLARVLGDERPHPVDSAANDAVRTRLVSELRRIGLAPRITDDVVCNGGGQSRAISCARVRNVVATMGTGSGPHLLLVSHYDSTPVGPGAADDGIGMAVMLEVAARLRGRALGRPVTFLFNEGEEAGLLGARAFLARDPLAPRVDALLNFEARGVTGSALMFETSRPNAAALAPYARAVARPAANSLATDFYRLIPNSTDVAVFEARPWTILNFAIIGNETRYHTPDDRLAALDPRSVQHMGDQALALAEDMASGTAKPTDLVTFTDIAGRVMVVLPATIALAALGLCALLTTGAAAVQRRAAWRGMGVALVALLAGAMLAFAGQAIVALFRPGEFWRAYPDVTAFAAHLSAAAGAALMVTWLGRPATTASLRLGFWLLFALLGLAASLALPGATIFFLLPLAPFAIGALAARRWPVAERIGGIVAAAALFLLWAPLLWLGGVLLSYGTAWAFAPVAALILLPWLIELRGLAATPPLHAAAALFPLAALGWLAAALAPAYSAARKQPFGVEYAWDVGRRESRWLIVNDGAPLPGSLEPLAFDTRTKVNWSGRPRWAASAPAALAEPATVAVLASTTTNAGRRVNLRLQARGAETVTLRAPPDARVIEVRAGGSVARPGTGKPNEPWVVRCHGRACDGLRLDLQVTGAPAVWQVIGMRAALPAAAAPILATRPAHAQPQYSPDSSLTTTRIRL